jgi:hypothetical protein
VGPAADAWQPASAQIDLNLGARPSLLQSSATEKKLDLAKGQSLEVRPGVGIALPARRYTVAQAAAAEKAARQVSGKPTFGTERELAEAWYKSDPTHHLRQTSGFGGSTQRGGGIEARSALLLITGREYKTFLEKSRAVLNDLGSCEESLEILRSLLDATDSLPESLGKAQPTGEGLPQPAGQMGEDVLEFRAIKGVDSASVAALAEAYANTFTEEEQAAVESLFGSSSVYAKPPVEYDQILGNSAYTLNSRSGTMLKGVSDDIELTEEEREAITRGGVSEGALTLLYLTAIQECGS